LVGWWTLVVLDVRTVEPVGEQITLDISKDGAVSGVSCVNRLVTRPETVTLAEGRFAVVLAAAPEGTE
jgi:hypothetical protein